MVSTETTQYQASIQNIHHRVQIYGDFTQKIVITNLSKYNFFFLNSVLNLHLNQHSDILTGMQNLSKIDVKLTGTDEIVFVYITLNHIEEITKCSTQARPLFLEIQTLLQDLKAQSEQAYSEQLTLKVEQQHASTKVQEKANEFNEQNKDLN